MRWNDTPQEWSIFTQEAKGWIMFISPLDFSFYSTEHKGVFVTTHTEIEFISLQISTSTRSSRTDRLNWLERLAFTEIVLGEDASKENSTRSSTDKNKGVETRVGSYACNCNSRRRKELQRSTKHFIPRN
ncbi:uncharacterized protein FOMMEDRAFT_135504 [Fomitiporia mediterranea MF3/22]|uniref:uncharacterized protein n=1 Tax=Fomitiporia mediterranea (strain MF3/22) TaxID=694068 RepID=UPI0004407C21|nr:uncharacterized protein FOMMEDRAFT_135504 [Fomitiporia mediterranea MF3/22]EJD01272.1 hypothetical protein FOMMEDRAFT_135504 [Fomitiporia mediterranea MF3/22]